MKHTKMLLALVFLALPILTFAQSKDVADLKTQIEALREERKEIKAKVESGEMTKEEAKVLWAEKMTAIRAAKEAAFNTRITNIQEKFKKRAEENPDKAEVIKAHMTEVNEFITTQRKAAKAFNEDLRAKMKSGEMTREEGKQLRSEKHEELKEVRQAKREEFKEERKEERETIMTEKKEANKKEMEELKGKVESGEVTKEEAKEMIQERREEQKEKIEELKEKKEGMKGKKKEVEEDEDEETTDEE